MNIERLKELKNVVVLNSWLSERAKKELTTLIDEAIARQSAEDKNVPTSEEVAEAIDWLETGDFEIIVGDEEYTANSSHHPNTSRFRKTAITALQSYQPTTRKNRIVEEVAISKTETTSEPCEYCRKPIYLKWNVSFIDGYYKLNDDCNYCPNCGRKLPKPPESEVRV